MENCEHAIHSQDLVIKQFALCYKYLVNDVIGEPEQTKINLHNINQFITGIISPEVMKRANFAFRSTWENDNELNRYIEQTGNIFKVFFGSEALINKWMKSDRIYIIKRQNGLEICLISEVDTLKSKKQYRPNPKVAPQDEFDALVNKARGTNTHEAKFISGFI